MSTLVRFGIGIAAGWDHTLARRSDGSVVAWGDNWTGQCNVPPLPVGLGYVEVVTSGHHVVARRSDSALVAWGLNNLGQCGVPSLPAGLTYVQVAVGDLHTVARRSDGSLISWGYNGFGLGTIPVLPGGIAYVDVAAGALGLGDRDADAPARGPQGVLHGGAGRMDDVPRDCARAVPDEQTRPRSAPAKTKLALLISSILACIDDCLMSP